MDELQPLPLDTESFEKMRTAKEPMLSFDSKTHELADHCVEEMDPRLISAS